MTSNRVLLELRSWIALSFSLCLSLASSAQSSAPIRVAVVGLEHGHVSGFLNDLPKHPEVQLVAIVDPDAALSARYEAQYKLGHSLFYSDIDSMVAAKKPQALLVFTSIAGHRQAIEAGARNHLTVMVEKPLTMSFADALAIRETARKANIQVLVNYETTWYSSNLAAYNAVVQGKLGDLRKVVIHDGHEGPKEIGVQPEFLTWLNDPAKNGQGALYDFGCYGADLMTWFMHGQAPISVTAVGQTDKPDTYGVYDDATIILRYPKAQAVLMPSWNWPFARKDSELYGATGYLVTVGPSHYRQRLKGEPEEEPIATAPPIPAPNDSSMHYLAAVVNGQLTPKADLNSLDTNVVVMQILDAARESAKTGITVTLKALPY